MKPPYAMGGATVMVQRAETLLESLTVVVSACVVQYADRPAQVHVLSGSDVPVSEVVRTVASALLTGLGLEVAASQIFVAQSRLAADDLVRLLGRDVGQAAAQPASEPVAPPASPPAPPMRDPMPESEAIAAPVQTPDHAPASGPASVPDSLMSEPAPPPASETQGESRNDTQPTPPARPRFRLLNVDVVRDDTGGLAVGVRLRGNSRSVERRRSGADTEEAIRELPAAAALEAVQELMGAEGWGDGQQVTLKLLGVRRLRTAQHDFVVVLVEACVNGQTLPLAGSAAADDGVERASIKAALQATNPVVTGPPVADSLAPTSAPRAVGGEDPIRPDVRRGVRHTVRNHGLHP